MERPSASLATRTTYISAFGSSLSSRATMAVPCRSGSSSTGLSDSPRQSNQCPSKRSSWRLPGPIKNACSRSQPVSRTATFTAAVPSLATALSDSLTRSKLFSQELLSFICVVAELACALRRCAAATYHSLGSQQRGIFEWRRRLDGCL